MNKDHHQSFNDFFTDEINELLNKIESEIGDNYTPNSDLILRVLRLNLNDVKVIWLGQDPYFQEGVATGRSFEASNITSWFDKYKQVSLKNIIRGIYKAYNGEFISYNEIKEEIKNGRFNILPPKDFFNDLENQGVMFLNTYLTTMVNKANTHRDIWLEFSMKLFNYIATNYPDIIWFLWGAEAKSVLNYTSIKKYYLSRHPMMCSSKNSDDFQFNPCFKETKNIIKWIK